MFICQKKFLDFKLLEIYNLWLLIINLELEFNIKCDYSQIEQNLKKLESNDRKQIIDAYSRVVSKFQKWIFQLYFKRSLIKIDPETEPKEDDQIIINFAYIYSQMLPSIYFYQLKSLMWIQGFDLISLLITEFKYLGISFRDLPIVYQSVFDQIEISLVWYDDKLKQKLEEFYKKIIPLLQLNSDLVKLNILPVSLLESKEFENIVKNSDKIRVNAKNVIIPINSLGENLRRNFPLKEYFEFTSKEIHMMTFELKEVKENQNNICYKNKRESLKDSNKNKQEGKLITYNFTDYNQTNCLNIYLDFNTFMINHQIIFITI